VADNAVLAEAVALELRLLEPAVRERASLRSSLWVRGQDGWRLIFHQGTPVGRGA
jgi:hypothetical protein